MFQNAFFFFAKTYANMFLWFRNSVKIHFSDKQGFPVCMYFLPVYPVKYATLSEKYHFMLFLKIFNRCKKAMYVGNDLKILFLFLSAVVLKIFPVNPDFKYAFVCIS